MRYFIIAVFLLIIQKNQAQSISVDQNSFTPQQLVEDILTKMEEKRELKVSISLKRTFERENGR